MSARNERRLSLVTHALIDAVSALIILVVTINGIASLNAFPIF